MLFVKSAPNLQLLTDLRVYRLLYFPPSAFLCAPVDYHFSPKRISLSMALSVAVYCSSWEPAMLYRILTENKNKRMVAIIVAMFFKGFTLLEGTGFWNRKAEPTLVVEIETDDKAKVVEAATSIKQHNEQEAVMIQEVHNSAWFV